MKLLASLAPCEWIAEEPVGPLPCVMWESRLPPGLPSWVKIFHDLHEDLSVTDPSLTWDAWDKARPPTPMPDTETGRILAEVLARSTLPYGAPGPDARLVRLRWAELCRRLGMTLSPTSYSDDFRDHFGGWSWPRHLVGPGEGIFDGPQRDALVSVLHRHTAVERILFHFWFLATTEPISDSLIEGVLEDALRFPDATLGARETPSHWFPEDHAWLVCSHHDLTYTLVGGSEALIRDLLEQPVLECLRVRVGRTITEVSDPG